MLYIARVRARRELKSAELDTAAAGSFSGDVAVPELLHVLAEHTLPAEQDHYAVHHQRTVVPVLLPDRAPLRGNVEAVVARDHVRNALRNEAGIGRVALHVGDPLRVADHRATAATAHLGGNADVVAAAADAVLETVGGHVVRVLKDRKTAKFD